MAAKRQRAAEDEKAQLKRKWQHWFSDLDDSMETNFGSWYALFIRKDYEKRTSTSKK